MTADAADALARAHDAVLREGYGGDEYGRRLAAALRAEGYAVVPIDDADKAHDLGFRQGIAQAAEAADRDDD